MSEHPLSQLRALKGAPLSCLIAMHIAAQPVGANWLSAITGYAHQAITKALIVLREFQLAVETSRFNGWTLTPHGQQLVLPAPVPPSAENQPSPVEYQPSPA